MLRKSAAFLFLVTILLIWGPVQGNADTLDNENSDYILITNDTGYDIYFLYISHEDSGGWEEDVLEDEVLADGETAKVDIYGYSTSIFDIRLEDEDGDTYTLWDVDVETTDIVVTLDDLDE